MNTHKCLVIGYGSIGKRHTRILRELGHRVVVVSRRIIDYPYIYSNIKDALIREQPDYVVIANETSRHEETLSELNNLDFDKKILVEKPLYSTQGTQKLNSKSLFVGYNLRFHPIVQELSKKITNSNIISVQCYVGQYLPSWRPGTDYSKSYSASMSSGGGVLRDLSHELDYLQFLFGDWTEMAAIGGKFSHLEIDSDDHFSFIYKSKQVPLLTLHMNYLDHLTQRFLIINTNETTYKADFMNNTLQINGEVQQFQVDRDYTYREQHRAILSDKTEFLCTFNEGLKVVNMVEFAKKASAEKVWVINE